MKNNELDKEYYVMSVDGSNNHPKLAWGDTDDTPFLENTPIDISELELPLKASCGVYARGKLKVCRPSELLRSPTRTLICQTVSGQLREKI